MDPSRKKVFYYAVCSRVGFILLSAFANYILPDHHSDDCFQTAAYTGVSKEGSDGTIWSMFGGLVRWDAQHFLHIAQFGYTYESNLAFFPLFPLSVRLLGRTFLDILHITTGYLPSLLLAAILINNIVFIKSVMVLYDLTLFVFNNMEFSYMTSILFCLSPATVFFIAPYTESFFSYCAFKGMLDMSRRKVESSLFWFSLSVWLRSNGITYAGFLIHAWAYYCIIQFSLNNLKQNLRLILRFTFKTFQYLVIICFPYILFQLYTYWRFCVWKPKDDILVVIHAEIFNLTTPADPISWCGSNFKFSYFIVQEKYWNVGFLTYYTWKQIPNFILAAPVVYLILLNGMIYLRRNYQLLYNPKKIYNYTAFLADGKKSVDELPERVFLYFVHIIFLTVWGLLHINVQVLTRLIGSSSPVLYWVAAQHFTNLPTTTAPLSRSTKFIWNTVFPFQAGKYLSYQASFILYYFVGYTLIGIVLFSNGLPWT